VPQVQAVETRPVPREDAPVHETTPLPDVRSTIAPADGDGDGNEGNAYLLVARSAVAVVLARLVHVPSRSLSVLFASPLLSWQRVGSRTACTVALAVAAHHHDRSHRLTGFGLLAARVVASLPIRYRTGRSASLH